ncbi:uncharacterized protein LOC142335427 [Convolutriloba macropyga]|uniref:uncharacterized protein LOC142335427 n=1 Tax=Convolutriloba macropyga TaxID=536237 RepID=UPI003F5233A1
MDSEQNRKLILVKVGLFGSFCLVLTLLVHGSYLVNADTFHYGIWKYCLQSAQTCTDVDDVMSGRWQREISAARFFLISGHLGYVVCIFLVIGAILEWSFLNKTQLNLAIAFASMISFLLLLFGMALVSDVAADTLRDNSSARLDWSSIIPWIGTLFGLLQCVESLTVFMLTKKRPVKK